MTGLSSGHKSLVDTLDNYVEDYNYPDVIVTTSVTQKNIIDRLNKIPEIEKSESRLTGDTFVMSPGGRLLSCSVFSFNDDDLQKFYFWDSLSIKDDEYVYIDYELARGNNIKVGDTLDIRINEEYRSYQVAGIVSGPQTLTIQTHGNKWSTNSDFGYIFAPSSLLGKETIKRKEEEKKEIDKQKQILETNEAAANEYILTAQQQLQLASMQLESGQALYNTLNNGTKDVREELIISTNTLISYTNELKNQLSELEYNKAEINSLITSAQFMINELESVSKAFIDIENLEKQINDVNNALSDNQTKALLSLLSQMNNYSLDDLFKAVSSFNDILSTSIEYGFSYDISQSVNQIINNLIVFLDDRKADLTYLSSEEVFGLLDRIVSGEEGIETTIEYINLRNIIYRYTYDYDGDIIASYYRAYDRLYAFVNFVEQYDIYNLLPLLNTFSSSASLKETLDRVMKIQELLPLLSSFSGTDIYTTHDLVIAMQKAMEKIEDTKNTIIAQRNQIVAILSGYGITIDNIPEYLNQLNNTIASADQVLVQIDSAISSISSGLTEIEEYLKAISKVLGLIDEEFVKAKNRLNQSRRQLYSKQSDLNIARAEYLKQFKNLNLEIEKAYAELDNSEGYEDLANQFMFYLNKDSNPDLALAKIKAVLGQECEIKDGFVYEDSPIKARIDANNTPLETMSYFVPTIFFAIVLVVVFLFMSLIIRQCRREIGILRALGFSKNKVTGIFCLINLLSSLIAVMLGLGLGKLVSVIIGNIYAKFYPLPVFNYEMNYKMFFVSAILTITVGQIATILSALPIASISPSEAMSRDLPDSNNLPSSIQNFISGLSPINKFSVASLIRNPLKFIFSIICIGATIVLIFVSLSIFASTDYMLSSYYDKQINYDVEIFFVNKPDQNYINQLEKLDYVSNVEKVSYYYVDLEKDDKTKSTIIKTVENNTDLICAYDIKGKQIDMNNKLIIDKTVADNLDINKNDEIKIDGITYTVDDISRQTLNFYNYLCDEKADKLNDADLYTLICNIDSQYEQQLLKYLSENDDYLYSIFTSVSESSLERALRIYDNVVMMIIGFSMIIGLIIVLNTAMTNILEKARELSVLRTLGFQHSDVSKSWFGQSILFFICSCLIGIPSGIWITKICLDKLSRSSRLYVFVSGIKEYCLTLLLVFAYICLSHFITMNNFRKWEYIEIVKDKE